MDKKEFKKALAKVLSKYGFESKGNIFRTETDELIIVVATQKSNYENSYYINFGFLIKSLNSDIINPKDNQCDVFGRFTLDILDKVYTSINCESLNIDEFCDAFSKSMNDKIKPVLEYGLKKYFEINPLSINTATLKAKQYISKQN
ncbi:MAG: DUF4304 domain-containing protein [Sedimentibacter sp.]|uniref:DUF4304 domain-containing protein n=1 Tax=Sedimentibacter sp. TaxID=1960295 RepID=UPI003158AA1F